VKADATKEKKKKEAVKEVVKDTEHHEARLHDADDDVNH